MKRNWIALLLAALLALSLLAPVGALAETTTAWVKMDSKDGSLNLRQGPSKAFESIGFVKAGDAIQVYSGTETKDFEGEEWVQVKVSRTGKTGYIKTKYVTKDASKAVSAANTVYVSAGGGGLNVRTGPGKGYEIAGYAVHGEAIEVLERGTTWSRVKVVRTGKTGYIKTKYIKGSTSTGKSGSSSASTSSGGSYDVASVMTKAAGGVVNMRGGAGTGYAPVAKLTRGTRLKVTGKSGNWYKVSAAGQTGYILKDYVAFGVSGKTTGEGNFRSGAGTGYGIIRALKAGTAVTVHSISGKWAKISVGGTTGYIHTSYLSY